MAISNKPIANSMIVLREEFDDWAILFDPDTGNAFGLNPVGVFIWKHLKGKYTIEDVGRHLRNACSEVPSDAEDHIKEFVDDLVEKGLVGYEL